MSYGMPSFATPSFADGHGRVVVGGGLCVSCDARHGDGI